MRFPRVQAQARTPGKTRIMGLSAASPEAEAARQRLNLTVYVLLQQRDAMSNPRTQTITFDKDGRVTQHPQHDGY